MSRSIFFDFSLNGLSALLCRSAWRSCRWGWFSIFFASSRTREFSACFTTACGNPDTLKSMSLSSRCVVAPFWLDLRLRFCLCLCLYLNVQQTNWYSRSQVRNVCRFPEHSNGTFVLSLQVALFCELDLGLVGLVGSVLLVEQLLNPIPSSNYLSKKFSEAAEVIHVLFRLWFLQFPSWSLSGIQYAGSVSWRMMAFDRVW